MTDECSENTRQYNRLVCISSYVTQLLVITLRGNKEKIKLAIYLMTIQFKTFNMN